MLADDKLKVPLTRIVVLLFVDDCDLGTFLVCRRSLWHRRHRLHSRYLRHRRPRVIALKEHPQGVIVPVKVQPGARRNGLAGEHAGALKVQVTQAPERGKATDAVLETIADELRLKRSQVSLLSGATSQQKRVLISGVALADLAERLRSVLEDA